MSQGKWKAAHEFGSFFQDLLKKIDMEADKDILYPEKVETVVNMKGPQASRNFGKTNP